MQIDVKIMFFTQEKSQPEKNSEKSFSQQIIANIFSSQTKYSCSSRFLPYFDIFDCNNNV